MDDSSPRETGTIKGCLNQIKRMFYWTLGVTAISTILIIVFAIWQQVDRKERRAEQAKEREAILAAEAKLEGFESLAAYKAHNKKIASQERERRIQVSCGFLIWNPMSEKILHARARPQHT